MIRPVLNSLITGFAMPACVAGSDSVGPDISVTDAPNVAVSQANLLVGTTDGALGGNGLAFAAADDTIDTLVGKPNTVKMVRFHRDRDTMKVTVLVSKETVTLNEDFYDRIYGNRIITLGDETLDINESNLHPEGGGIITRQPGQHP